MRLFASLAALVVAALALASPVWAQETVIIQGEITSNTTLTAGPNYLLRGAVFVREGATLQINAGTQIFGEQASLGTLIIDRGATLIVRGNKKKPVVMTSDQPIGQRARGDWGGLIINGRAPINVPGGEAEGEGDTGTYGGDDPNDSSGSIKYLRVEFAGIEFSPDNELNCLALQGVGRGTKLSYIQCHMNKDDGFEFFGGTAQLKFAVSSAIGDDSFDATDGWTGAGQFWLAWQVGDDADQGFEIDNNGENNNLTPRTSPTVSNFTLVGDDSGVFGTESDIGMLIREGAAGTWQNGVVGHFAEFGYTNTEKATFNNYADGSLVVRSMVFQNNGSGLARSARGSNGCSDDTEGAIDVEEQGGNRSQDSCQQVYWNVPGQNTDVWATSDLSASDRLLDFSGMLAGDVAARRAPEPNFGFAKNSVVYDGTVEVAPVPDDVVDANGKKFFKKAKFIGGVGPRGGLSRWYQGWTNFETDIVAASPRQR